MGKSIRHKLVNVRFSSDKAERNGLWSGFDNMLYQGVQCKMLKVASFNSPEPKATHGPASVRRLSSSVVRRNQF